MIFVFGFFGFMFGFGFFIVLIFYVESWKYGIILVVFMVISVYGFYFSWIWKNFEVVVGIIVFFIVVVVFGIWYISEFDFGFVDCFKSVESFERVGKYK